MPAVAVSPSLCRACRWVLAIAIALLLASGAMPLAAHAQDEDAPDGTAVGAGQPAPAFTLADPAGTPHRLADLRGEVVMVMFWVSWAENCLHMGDAHLLRIYRSLHDADKPFRVVLIGGSHRDDAMRQNSVARQHDWPFLLLHDPENRVARQYGAENWGWLTLIDESGTVVGGGNSHEMLGTMEAWLRRHFEVDIATASHGNSPADESASTVMAVIVGVLAVLVLATTRRKKPAADAKAG